MRRYLLLLLVIWSSITASGQKKVINAGMYGKWPTLAGTAVISNDGKFVAYDVKEGSIMGKTLKLVIQSTASDWKIELPGPIKSFQTTFSSNSRHCIFMNDGDSLGIFNLTEKKISYMSNVLSYTLNENGSTSRLVYSLNDKLHTVRVRNLQTDKEQSYSNTLSNWLSDNGNTLVLLRTIKSNNANLSLEFIDLKSNKLKTIWQGYNAESFIVDFKHKQIAFLVKDSIWYFKDGMSQSICITSTDVLKINKGLKVGSLTSFSNSGDGIYLMLNEIQINVPKSTSESGIVEVWSYKDPRLHSDRQNNLSVSQSYRALLNLPDLKLIQLQNKYDLPRLVGKKFDAEYQIIQFKTGDGTDYESNWNVLSERNTVVINNRTGERKSLDDLKNIPLYHMWLSPNGEYVVYYQAKEKRYFSYNLTTRKAIDLTKDVQTSWLLGGRDGVMARGVAGWLLNSDSVLIYDSNDIWQVSMTGRFTPINLTNGFGVRKNIVFRILFQNDQKTVLKNQRLNLSAFNVKNKDNGFFYKKVGSKGDPIKLTMGPFFYTASGNDPMSVSFSPIKAKNSEAYLLKRMSDSEEVNYFYTTDFKSFKSLSHFHDQKEYNWYTTELHSWRSIEGKTLQGILYKPEDFDSSHKYPIILHYYERKSDQLNVFLRPNNDGAQIDIPTFVSNGYLVFVPDIYNDEKDPMQGTYNDVVSAANYLSTFPFVNVKKMGLQGHSWGAIQTNYLITRTNLFAAACSSSGTGDWISLYGTLEGFGNSKSYDFEIGQHRMRSTLWENKEGYIKNSPVLNAEKVTTPLLMKHGVKDDRTPFSNALEFFLGLRRLGKKVWLLVYPKGQHVLDGSEAADFGYRMTQFFDHYLKDKPTPLWMLEADVNNQKEINSDLELDTKGQIPGAGLLVPNEQKKVDSLTTSVHKY